MVVLFYRDMKASMKPREDGQYILQVLLPPNRGKLYVDQVQQELDQRPSFHLKELVFNYLENNIETKDYQSAKESDDLNWKEIVARRAEGHKKAREAKEHSKMNQTSENQ